MGMALPLAVPASTLPAAPNHAPIWSLLDLCGRLVELSAGADAAPLTAAFGLVLDAQLRGDRAAWVTLDSSSFFPPDVLDGGIDLEALPVVRVPDGRLAGRAADTLVRSGGFGLVVIDLSGGSGRLSSAPETLPTPLLARLLGMARQHGMAVVILTRKSRESPSLHSLVSLRTEARWRRRGDHYELRVAVLKDKRGGPGWTHVEACRGPAGLR